MSKLLLFAFVFCLPGVLSCPRKAWCAESPSGLSRDTARIIRDKNSKQAVLIVDAEIPWRIYASRDLRAFDYEKPLLSGQGSGTFAVPVVEGGHCFFALQSEGGTLILAEEHLPMAGGYNFRDLGGIPTKDGKFTAWGRLIRADSLAHLTDRDLEYLATLPLATVVDFRTRDGMESSPDKLPETVKLHLHLPMSPGNLDRRDTGISGEQAWDNFMLNVNRELVLQEEHIAMYRKLFTYIQDEKNLPLLFHCAAGKDRTGLAAAYTLLALGVDKEEVLRNYMASARYLKGKYDHLIEKEPDRAPLFTVEPRYLEAGIAAMKEKSGSVENYLTRELGIDPEKMRALFLQP